MKKQLKTVTKSNKISSQKLSDAISNKTPVSGGYRI